MLGDRTARKAGACATRYQRDIIFNCPTDHAEHILCSFNHYHAIRCATVDGSVNLVGQQFNGIYQQLPWLKNSRQ
jgi:hypothetical protein